METHIGNRTSFMLHGDECTLVKGHFFCGKNANKDDLCSSTSCLVSSQRFVVVIIGGGGDSFTA